LALPVIFAPQVRLPFGQFSGEYNLTEAAGFHITFASAKISLRRESVLSNQLLRSGTSIGANLHEAQYAQGTKDFVSKLEIALKECHETEYWLELLFETGYIPQIQYQPLQNQCGTIRRMLIASIRTVKRK